MIVFKNIVYLQQAIKLKYVYGHFYAIVFKLKSGADAVDKWSKEKLETWTRKNVTKDTIPQQDWHQIQVAIWARNVLNFSEKSAKILIDEEVTGHTLLAIPNLDGLISYGLPRGATDSLWPKIEKMKTSRGIR